MIGKVVLGDWSGLTRSRMQDRVDLEVDDIVELILFSSDLWISRQDELKIIITMTHHEHHIKEADHLLLPNFFASFRVVPAATAANLLVYLVCKCAAKDGSGPHGPWRHDSKLRLSRA